MAGFGDWLGPLIGLGGAAAGRNENFGMGAPYRDRLRDITNDPNAYYSSPEAQALANASDRRYSSIVGNPAGSGTAQTEALDAMRRGYGAERDRLFNYGGGAYFNRAAPGGTQGVFSALGPIGQLLGRGIGGGGGAGGSADISSLFNNPNYMGGGGMGFD